MTRLEFLLQQRAWVDRMLSLDTLPGTLTLDKVKEIAIETEVELVDFERFDAYGKMHYSRDAEASGDGR